MKREESTSAKKTPLRIDFEALREAFSRLSDPRVDRTKVYSLFDIIGLTLIAQICGADNWVAIETFAKAKSDWLKNFVNFSDGPPSHDTLSRVFGLIDANEFSKCLVEWLKTISSDGRLLNIDGKTIKGSRSQANGIKALHVVSAWLSEAGISIGQIACNEKSNEITAIPDLLELIDINGKIVTIDAMGCQKAIAQQIIEKQGDFVLGLKGNQGNLHEAIKLSFEGAIDTAMKQRANDFFSTVEKDHGRLEERDVYVFHDSSLWKETSDWIGLNTIIVTDRKRTIFASAKTSIERQYYISSLKNPSAELASQVVRGHWSVENKLHWHLDVTFKEDSCQTIDRNAAQNLSVVRKAALTLLERTKKTYKCGIATLRSLAGWNTEVAEAIIKKASPSTGN